MADSSYSISPFSRRNPGTLASRMAGINSSLQATAIGRGAYAGAADALGFYVPGLTGQAPGSFLGISETVGEMGFSTTKFSHRASSTLRGAGKLASAGKFSAAGKALSKQSMRAMKAVGAKGVAKFAGKTALKSIPLVSTIAMAYMGYQEGGVMGALGGVGESMLWSAIPQMIGASATGAALAFAAGPGILAGVGLATYALGEAGRAHAKGLKQTEFASAGAVDALSSAGAATNRQRSMMALNNTHLNGRMAMGNEGILMHGDMTTGMRGFR